MTETMKQFEDLGYVAIADVKEHHVDFAIFEDGDYSSLPPAVQLDHLDPLFEGYIKWDGCSNWDFPDKHYPLHFCGKTPAKNFGLLIPQLYEWCVELMPEHKEYFEED